MQFVTISRRETDRFTEADFEPLVEPERERARTLYVEGFIRQIWHRGDVPGACMLVEAESEAAVRATLATLPMFEAGMLSVEAVVPLRPYAGFGPRT